LAQCGRSPFTGRLAASFFTTTASGRLLDSFLGRRWLFSLALSQERLGLTGMLFFRQALEITFSRILAFLALFTVPELVLLALEFTGMRPKPGLVHKGFF
jgi:hypothetical protein